ncbi:MAG: hypothetical protein HY820_30990 [Acidobacteria bacterium]|nr:hypothetical protein [Acidobacteriota bacterium]
MSGPTGDVGDGCTIAAGAGFGVVIDDSIDAQSDLGGVEGTARVKSERGKEKTAHVQRASMQIGARNVSRISSGSEKRSDLAETVTEAEGAGIEPRRMAIQAAIVVGKETSSSENPDVGAAGEFV